MECQSLTKKEKKCKILTLEGKFCYLHQQNVIALPLFSSIELKSKKAMIGNPFSLFMMKFSQKI